MAKVKAVLFDVDGVLIDSEDAYPRVVQKALARFAGIKRSKKQILRFAGRAGAGWFRGVLPNAPNALIKKMFNWGDGVYWSYYLPRYSRPMPGVTRTLRELKKRGFKLGIVTNQTRREMRVTQRIIRFAKFDVLVSAEDASPKPSPAGLRLALKKLRLKPSEALYVGDTETDARTCAPLGVRLVLISWKRNERTRGLRGFTRLKRFSDLLNLV